MSEVLERALADLAKHPNSSALEISRRLGVLDDRRVFKALDQAAYDGKCQRTRTGNGPWRWEIPLVVNSASAATSCPCFALDVDPETVDDDAPDGVCACGHTADEHDATGQCQAAGT